MLFFCIFLERKNLIKFIRHQCTFLELSAIQKTTTIDTHTNNPCNIRMSAQGNITGSGSGAVTSELNIIFSEYRPLNLGMRARVHVCACHRSYYRGHLVPE